MSNTSVNVAVAQVVGTADIDKNLRALETMTAEAASQGANIVLFPEAVMYKFSAPAEELSSIAETHGQVFESHVAEIAAKHQIAIVAGTYSKGRGFLARNMLVAKDSKGNCLGRYQKLHLYDAFHYKESSKSEPASLQPNCDELVSFNIGSFTFGLVNCYDLRFPEMARALVDQGVNVLLVSSAWVPGPLKEFQWEVLLKARAIENTCFVAASCQPGPSSVGLSTILDPSGVPISTIPAGDGVATATLDMERLASVRAVLPCLEQRRYAVTQRE